MEQQGKVKYSRFQTNTLELRRGEDQNIPGAGISKKAEFYSFHSPMTNEDGCKRFQTNALGVIREEFQGTSKSGIHKTAEFYSIEGYCTKFRANNIWYPLKKCAGKT